MWGRKARRIRDLVRENNVLRGIVDERGEALAERDQRIEELETYPPRVFRAIDRQADDPPEPLPEYPCARDGLDEWFREVLSDDQSARRIGLWDAVEDPTGETP